jgi:hypothetical protein
MFIKAASICVLLTFASCILPLSAQAQFISTEVYETEEDLLEGLQQGYLTLDQYLELLDMIRSKLYPASDEADRLIFVPGVSSLEVSQAKAEAEDRDLNQIIDPFLAKDKNDDRPALSGRLVWRWYQGLPAGDGSTADGGAGAYGGQDEGKTESYLLCEVADGQRMIWRIEADQLGNSSQAPLTSGDFRIRKRSLKLLLPEYSSEVVLGNFDKRIGLGLNVGYHPLFGAGSDSDFKTEDSFLYPAMGRYNGIFAESGHEPFVLAALYSKNKRQGIENRIGAVDLTFASKEFRAGLCLSDGDLRNVKTKNALADDCRSFHFAVKLKPLTLSGEYALLSSRQSGLAVELYSSRKRYGFDFSWWRYDDNFVHPHGGGISNPDYESIHLDEIDYTYRSRQAGERGVFFKSRYRILEKLGLDFSYNRWREGSNLPDKMKLRLGSGYKFSRDFSITVYHLWSDYRVDDEQIDRNTSSLNLFLSPHDKLHFDLIANYRSASNKDYGDLRLKIGTQAVSPFDLVLWLKCSDPDLSQRSDRYFSLHLQEGLRFFENCFVSVECIAKFYEDGNKVDTKAVRVKMETSW